MYFQVPGSNVKRRINIFRCGLLFCALGLSCFAPAAAPFGEEWVGTWAASPEGLASGKVVSTGTTYREIVHTSTGGAEVRIVVTNEFGHEPLTIGAARIASSKGGATIEPSTSKVLRFGGQDSVTLPAGTMAVSDAVGMELPALADVAVSLFVPAQPISQFTVHSYALQTNYVSAGNVIDASTQTAAKEVSSWYFLKAIEVEPEEEYAARGAIVALGDSITDGAASAPNINGRWPNVLAARIQADKALTGLGVLNAGINGNRLLHYGYGESALIRLDRDVLTQAGVKYLIVLEGINDIGHIVAATPSDPAETAPSIIRALQQVAVRAHTHGIKVIGATITPYESCKYSSPEGEKMRQAVNDWIRTTKDLDSFVDFEKIVRDPAHPTRFLPSYDSGDHLHPNAAGLRAMGSGIDLGLFKTPPN
jgi:lysophospholipase L1-like esterase